MSNIDFREKIVLYKPPKELIDKPKPDADIRIDHFPLDTLFFSFKKRINEGQIARDGTTSRPKAASYDLLSDFSLMEVTTEIQRRVPDLPKDGVAEMKSNLYRLADMLMGSKYVYELLKIALALGERTEVLRPPPQS